jgi:hypothetical protein
MFHAWWVRLNRWWLGDPDYVWTRDELDALLAAFKNEKDK